MEIYTGYFAQLDKYKAAGLIPVSIARVTPRWYIGAELKDLAPSYTLLSRYKSGKLTKEDYTRIYLKQLDKVKWISVMERLRDLGDSVVLLCYERSSEFCHRHILSDYLTESSYFTTEYIINKKE